MEENQYSKQELENLYQRTIDKLFKVSLLSIPIFLVPALMAVYFGLRLDAKFATDKKITLLLLVCSLVLSWVLVGLKNKKVMTEYTRVRKLMKESHYEFGVKDSENK